MKRILVSLATVAGLLAGGLVAAPQAEAKAAPRYTPPPIEWGTCELVRLQQAGAQCGFLVVPLDHGKPTGTKIKIAVSRKLHTTSNYQGVMIVNPGGPGGSGLIYPVLQGAIPNGAGQSYDWIGFDPRGVGASEPALSCDGSYAGYDRPLYEPITRSLEKTWLARSKRYAEACAENGGELLDHLKTTDTVADLEALRTALGQEKINWYGFSYGTYIGQVYATLHPDRVRRMVFDGVVNPERVWYRSNLDQDIAFERSIDIYWAWLARYDSVYHLGNTAAKVEARYYLERARLIKNPAGGKIGPSELTDILLGAGYYVYGWEDIAAAFSAWVNDRDPSGLIELYPEPGTRDDGSDNGTAMYLATICTDAKWPRNWNKVRADNWRTFTRAPFVTWANAWFNGPCLFWEGEDANPVRVDGSKAPPILMVNETYDGATPFSGALAVRRLFPRSVLIEGVGGTTHSGSLSGIACTDDAIAAYLADGTLPARVAGNTSDVKCDPVPQPDPTAAPAAARTLATSGGMDAELRAGIGGPQG